MAPSSCSLRVARLALAWCPAIVARVWNHLGVLCLLHCAPLCCDGLADLEPQILAALDLGLGRHLPLVRLSVLAICDHSVGSERVEDLDRLDMPLMRGCCDRREPDELHRRARVAESHVVEVSAGLCEGRQQVRLAAVSDFEERDVDVGGLREAEGLVRVHAREPEPDSSCSSAGVMVKVAGRSSPQRRANDVRAMVALHSRNLPRS
mmetsp:Transcript_23717/g.56588  ORF Transcript_23717/g.56588 Transcript_23717/m.56588 type:complete len:207 (-) Transcript_23717:430-1050(-)|eukprot:CAMPEP_0177709318 /NCGR_PEP_ID=MMETSP0484_2-20121128/10737_1 /TAXON_ID=354590 /ORGANISM="Rhodomonas lens, Strain RHODO" /LENGTH=206 /DNA_ID=CAMNT_0019220923 /DNA_START=365 /DNA_END=985 /DNA_ORIENTATION=+